jgi:anti-anti-sigma regulatory factor
MFRMLDTGSLLLPSRRARRSAGRSVQPPICTIRVQRHGDWTAVLLRGELDLESQGGLERDLRAELRSGRPVIVELAGLDFTDVNGIRALQRMVAHAASLTPPVPIELHGARGQVADLIAKLGLEGLLEPPSPVRPPWEIPRERGGSLHEKGPA